MYVSASSSVYLLFITGIFVTNAATDELKDRQSWISYYENGVHAYLENRFGDCVVNLEESIQKYKTYTAKLTSCRLKCRDEAEQSDPLFSINVEDLYFYEKAIKNTLCMLNCKNDPDLSGFNLLKATDKLFEEKKPYQYLHLCYFQKKDLQNAASAAFTYLVSHPNDTEMINSLKYYSTFSEVNMHDVINFDAKDYVYLYIHGSDAYDKKNWELVIQNMEESLISYLQAEEECRAQCEGPFDQRWFPDFVPSIANHFTYNLKCKRKCLTKLNQLNGEKYSDLLPSHYHFLQFSYYKLGNLKAACAAVASYLLFYPTDETMLENKEYYSKLPKVVEEYLTPRMEAVHYFQRDLYERRILKFIDVQFKSLKITQKNPPTEEISKMHVGMDQEQLNGTGRLVLDEVISKKDCKIFVDIIKSFAVQGDGYYGNATPHTAMEKFEGVTLGRIGLLVYFGLMNMTFLDLVLNTTENAKKYIKDRFRLKKQLHITYTHLVCRSAFSYSRHKRSDLSHAIHADNCNFLEHGLCEKLPPAYTWRDYSAILYLNDDFVGGEFFFTADSNSRNVQSVIEPKCGRMVAFSSGPENLHGVRAVKRGSRCALAFWFTFDFNYAEKERAFAYQLKNELSQNRKNVL